MSRTLLCAQEVAAAGLAALRISGAARGLHQCRFSLAAKYIAS